MNRGRLGPRRGKLRRFSRFRGVTKDPPHDGLERCDATALRRRGTQHLLVRPLGIDGRWEIRARMEVQRFLQPHAQRGRRRARLARTRRERGRYHRFVDGERILAFAKRSSERNGEDRRAELRHIGALIEARKTRRRGKREPELAPELLAVPLQRLERRAEHGVRQHHAARTRDHHMRWGDGAVRHSRYLMQRRDDVENAAGELERRRLRQRDIAFDRFLEEVREPQPFDVVRYDAEHGAVALDASHACNSIDACVRYPRRARLNGRFEFIVRRERRRDLENLDDRVCGVVAFEPARAEAVLEPSQRGHVGAPVHATPQCNARTAELIRAMLAASSVYAASTGIGVRRPLQIGNAYCALVRRPSMQYTAMALVKERSRAAAETGRDAQ